MVDLVANAYGLDADKVMGGPSWLEMDRFDISAKAPANASAESLKIMLQALLADRFKLVVHNDKKELPTFALRVGKKLLIKPADASADPGCRPPEQKGAPPSGPMLNINGVIMYLGPDLTISYLCRNMSMTAFTEELHRMPFADVGINPLVDETELKGTWDFDLKFSLALGPDNNGTTIFDAVEKQLGLKLEPIKAPLPVIVVDSVNRKPTDNPPGVTKILPFIPTEFEVADVKPSDPNLSDGPGGRGGGRGGGGVLPGGRIEYRGYTLKDLIAMAWNTTSNKVVGGPKFVDTDRFDIVAKAPAPATSGLGSGMSFGPQVDPEALPLMMQALLKDRFRLAVHAEDRPASIYTLTALKPKLKTADPANRTGCKDGPGPDGKDPRVANPARGRLVTCLNVTMAQFAELIPGFAGGYFGPQNVDSIVMDATGIEGAYDFTLSFSGAGILNGGGGGRGGRGRGGDAGPAPGAAGAAGEASDPGGGIALADAVEKQLGIKMELQKRPAPAIVIDHVEQKPTDN
jgi:uncharacterized protein (TIGR03435 family)